MNFFQALIEQSQNRIKEATLGVLGIRNEGLRRHIEKQFSDCLGAEGSFLANPVFEHTFGWTPGKKSFAELSPELLHPQLIKTLHEAPKYEFDKSIKPYKHQVEAWQVLTDKKPRSAVITTGTGSGKTECFMVPILDDLIREQKATQSALIGVRALFLYPLNALINSQQERLDAWTRQFEGDIRFCLYNGKTEHKASKSEVRKRQAILKNQILSRELLRKEPAPILMTNSTMLEYMLVRQVDSPILEISKQQQSLRWIVLDEAHTYVGSQAAELSLLLKRVVNAFGRQSKDIRFVATSATIADANAEEKLQHYLADLAGVPIEQVSVITGRRITPQLSGGWLEQSTPYTLDDVNAIDSAEEVSASRFKALSSSAIASKLRATILDTDKPQRLDDLVASVAPLLEGKTLQQQQVEVLSWLDVMTGTKGDKQGDPFLKVRAHFFQRMLHGLWACVDHSCNVKPAELNSFPFGTVYVTERSHCDCGAPVFEVVFCNECSEPHLLAADQRGKLTHRVSRGVDEFSLNIEQDDGDDTPADDEKESILRGVSSNVVIGAVTSENEHYCLQSLNRQTSEFAVIDDEYISIKIGVGEIDNCSACASETDSKGDFYRGAHLGAPFYITNAVPTVLEFCPDADKKDSNKRSPEELPGRGRKLITFTDSRQGTARMAVRMQHEAERSRIRGLVFQLLQQKNLELIGGQKAAEVNEKIEDLRMVIAYAKQSKQHDKASKKEQELERLLNEQQEPQTVNVLYTDLENRFIEQHDIKSAMLKYNRYANPRLFGDEGGPRRLTQLLMMREFSRRPKKQISTETLGLVAVGYEGLEQVRSCPQFWEETFAHNATGNLRERSKLTLDDWKNFLKVALDFYVRENRMMRMDDDLQNWMGSLSTQKFLFSPNADIQENPRIRKWPQVRTANKNRLVKLLELATGLSTAHAEDKDKINLWLMRAWTDLTQHQILKQSGSNGFQLELSSLNFSLPRKAWLCPNTYRLIDTTFRGLTPYLPRKLTDADYRCELVKMPDFTELSSLESGIAQIREIREKLNSHPTVRELRSKGVWNNLSDRIVEGGFYYRTAEHSAQQSTKTLSNYENLFKLGDVNVLNCSTTMEMGVDIGGISAVVMNNLPPHPANYLQRAGRAGRRKESRAIAYTLCKADPHNQRAFLNPMWPFVTAIPAPKVILSSRSIVQRHVNAVLLAAFLRTLPDEGDRTRLSAESFFGGEPSECETMLAWMDYSRDEFADAVKSVINQTSLAGESLSQLILAAKDKLTDIKTDWLEERQRIQALYDTSTDEPYKRALAFELSAHNSQFLLKELISSTFLPGHGFPTNVVELDHKNIEDFKESKRQKEFKEREDNVFVNKEKPSRSLNIALREYAPGATLVIDGRAYRSEGIVIKDFTNPGNNDDIHFAVAWRCDKCGTTGVRENAYANSRDLCCSNMQCRALIPEREKVSTLRPTGFLTDFWKPTSNDILTQKFIPVAEPRVSLIGEQVTLPNKDCGFVRFGHNGQIFHHTKGEYGYGFAVCLACGRAASMTATDTIPSELDVLRDHRPLGGAVAGDLKESCSGGHVKSNIALGYQVRTDVLEICLRNPLQQQWLTTSDEHHMVADTLAVAMREVLAEQLGISPSEIGFSTREELDLENGAPRMVIQLFDEASGGAGFVITAIDDLVGLLRATRKQLECPSQCDTVCSHCLAGNDSSVERFELDRRAAIAWLDESQILEHLELPQEFTQIPDAAFCSSGVLRAFHMLKNRAKHTNESIRVVLPMNGDTERWDLSADAFRSFILNLITIDKVSVTLALNSRQVLVNDLKRTLKNLEYLGVEISYGETAGLLKDVTLGFQLIAGDKTFSLLSNSERTTEINDDWLTDEHAVWVSSIEFPKLQLTPCNTSDWGNYEGAVTTKIVYVKQELDGALLQLPLRMVGLLQREFPLLLELIKNDTLLSISYSDRYLKSPWAVMMLMSFIKLFSRCEPKSIDITALKSEANIEGRLVFHDWSFDYEQREFMEQLISRACPSVNGTTITLKDNAQELQHSRKLELKWTSGRIIEVIFDQGFGYWKAFSKSYEARQFPFEGDSIIQVDTSMKLNEHLEMRHSGNWPTIITFNEVLSS
ncbi:DEAD/DEAH box helicase [Idiomarina baltica]|uniref:DEAD/DEAH box helicase n=1 Tax=Idiomarina baltica OS145 TaxID=314276 RepID=A0ABP2CVK6_9GAMM|nr:DEAD/DEAH box helicase [Idiomarina baltica]EAQ32828.1 hypothetical protein OS145_01677 [Idiomarina baltica OS145]